MRRSRLAVVMLVSGMSLALGLIALAWAVGPSSSQAQDDTMRNCPHPAKWAISVWDGADGSDAEQALATCGEGAVAVAYYIDPETQNWLRWFAHRPDISTLTALNDMQGVIALGRAQAPASPTASPTPTPPPIVNQTTHGVIGWDEIWRDEIRIIGDIIVEEGATLTIEPGTLVLVAANQDVDNLNDAPWGMQEGFEYGRPVETSEGVLLGLDEPYWDEGHHVSIRVNGTLHAVGTPEQMITITSDSATPGIYDWNFFHFEHGTLSYSIVQYYRCLNAGDEAEVSHNILRHVGGVGVAPGSAVIEHNTISYAGHELINIDHSSPVIRYNHLGPNPGRAGIVIDGGSPQIVGNTIEGCSPGIVFILPPDDPVIEGNTFLNNEEDIVHEY